MFMLTFVTTEMPAKRRVALLFVDISDLKNIEMWSKRGDEQGGGGASIKRFTDELLPISFSKAAITCTCPSALLLTKTCS